MSKDASDPLVRVRDRRNGVRFTPLSDWKIGIRERKKRKTERMSTIDSIRRFESLTDKGN